MNPPPVSLLLLASLILVSAPAQASAKEPDNAVDHAGILQSLDKESYANGETIYRTLCVNCHGADGITPPLPIARAFGRDELKFGTDPYSMFLTLTNGNGLMGAQTWMTPEERYNVIHYIREEFMRPMRDDFKEINDGYLEALPTVNVVVKESDNIERDFGPALASQLGRDISSVLTFKLKNNTSMAYNLHTMDQAGLWKGGFLDLLSTQHYRERGGGVPTPAGATIEGLQGWRWGHEGTLDYPTKNLLPRGPMPPKWLKYHGHYLHNDQVIFSYAIDGREIHELPRNPKGFGAIEHTLEIGPGDPLKLSVGKIENTSNRVEGFLKTDAKTLDLGNAGEIAVLGATGDTGLTNFLSAAVLGDTNGVVWTFDTQNRLVIDIPAANDTRVLQVVRFAGNGPATLLSFASYLRSKKAGQPSLTPPSKLVYKNERLWPEGLVTRGELGDSSQPYVLDTLGIPPNDDGNPYNTWFRTSALAFFPDGRMVVSTHGGDIWIVSGLDESLEELHWNRFAAGLYEPFGLQVIDDLIYVTCKDRITRLHDLNNDNEADFYESFSADDDVSTFFHAFNFDLQRDNQGNLYYAKAGQYTSYALAGSVIKVSPDGKKREVYCTGFRTPNGMGMMPDGRPTVSDNQGNWMPASKVSLCEPNGFYGYVQTQASKDWAPDGGSLDHTKVVPPHTFDQPVIWMPQDFDNSSGGQLWVDDERWGPLSGRLLHTSFGKGWLSYMMLQEVDGISQAAIVKLKLDADSGIHRARVNPADGQVYAVGLNGWNGGGRPGLSQGAIHRFCYTGAPSKLLTNVEVTGEGIQLTFNFKLSPEAATEKQRYHLKQWNYLWAQGYGSNQYSLENEWDVGADEVAIKEIIPGPDGKSVLLKIPGLQPVNQVEINLDLLATDGTKFEEQAYLTINKVPGKDIPAMKELTAERTFMWDRLEKQAAQRAREKAKEKARKQAAQQDAKKRNQPKPKPKPKAQVPKVSN
jgi:hypothetical protein